MSLRLRLIGLVAIALVVSLLVGGAIACLNASRSVGTEMRSALLLGRRAVGNSTDWIEASRDPQRDLERLVAVFDGNRHLRVSLVGDPAAFGAPVIEKSPLSHVPAWFVRLIGVPSVSDRALITLAGRQPETIVLETDPRNETLDVWTDFVNTLIVLLLFSVQTILLIYLFIGRALRPLYLLSGALEQIGQGNYDTRVGGRLAPELSRLHDSFNRMASRIAAANADNRRLNERLLTLQEEERAEIARDLHDEVGPYLFAINIDAAKTLRLLNDGRAAEASDHLRLITEAVGCMQHELSSVVRRLRPVGLAEFGLRDAIDNLVQFWRRRHPETDFDVTIAPECDALGGVIDTTIYRIVQECLNNALRHGEPTMIAVRLQPTADPERIMLEIADDGPGMSDAPGTGFGLRGMAERVAAIGGELSLRNLPGGGLAVVATLPCGAERALVSDPPAAGAR